MNGQYKRFVAAAGVVIAAMGAGLVMAASTSASDNPKTYTNVASESALVAGPQSLGITFTNTSRNRIDFNAINVSVPAGLTVSGSSLQLDTTGSVVLAGSTIEMRELSTPKGGSVTVSFTVTATVQAECGASTFVSDVRQSNDFNGVNNKFALQGSDATVTGPCSSTTVTCSSTDDLPCQTGTISSSDGNTASVLVNDTASPIDATLHASFSEASFTCPDADYPPTSDPIEFGIESSASLDGLTKTVTFTQSYDGVRADWQYQVCFRSPWDFPALRPSELAEDFAQSDFSGNTTDVLDSGSPTGHLFTGLLLPCGAGYLEPCLQSTVIDVDADAVTITVVVPARDPGMRF